MAVPALGKLAFSSGHASALLLSGWTSGCASAVPYSTAVLLVVVWDHQRWRVMSGMHGRDRLQPVVST